nr:MAG TPA: Tail tape measure [Caudoviricetes sp.]
MAIGIEITLDPSNVVTGADKVDKALDDIASSAENAQKILVQFENTKLDNISSSLESIKSSGTATVSALGQLKGAFDNLAESLKKTGNEENTTTNKTDALIQSLQRQIQLAKLTGVEAEKLKNSWKLGADASETQRYAVEKLTEQLARLKDAANDAGDATGGPGGGAGGGLSGIADAIGDVVGAGKLLIGLTIGSKVAEWAKEFVTTADAINLMQSRLKQFVETGESTDALFRQIQMSANAAGTQLESTLSVFGQFAKAGQDMGLSNDQVLKLISNLQKMALVSGASSESAAAAIYQLSQSFASGVLQGDEFRSVAEQMPTVLDNLAKKLGVTRGELRKMSSEGKIGQEQLALLAGEFTEVDAQAAKLPRTVEQASTALMNNLAVAADALNDKLGLSRGLAGGIDNVSAALDYWTKKLNGTVTPTDELNHTLDIQKNRLTELERIYDAVKTVNNSRTQALKEEIDQIKKSVSETEKQIGVYSRLSEMAVTLKNDLKAIQQTPKAPKADPDAQKQIDNLKANVAYTEALAKGNYELAASSKLGSNATKEQVAAYAALLKQQTDFRAGQKETKKATSEAESAAKREQKQLEQNQEANKKYIKTLTDKVNAGQFDVQRAKEQVAQAMLQGQSVEDLSASYLKSIQVQNQLTLQSKQAEAQSRLNADATDAQRQAVDAYVASLYKQEQAKQLAAQVSQIQTDTTNELNPVQGQLNAVDQQEAQRLVAITQWRAQFRADDLAAEQQYQDMKTQIQQAGEQQRNDIMMANNAMLLSASGDFLGGMADLLKNAQGEQSGIYKAMFAASKAFAIASATVSLWQNVSKAMSVGFPMNIPFIAGALAQGTSILSSLSSVQAAGFAQGGYVSGMGTGTSDSIPARLSNGEYVMPARQTRQYRNELAAMRAGSYNGGSGSNMNVKVDNYGGERVQVQQLTADDVRIIVGQEVPRVNEREFNNPYSRTNRAYKTNYEATRKT